MIKFPLTVLILKWNSGLEPTPEICPNIRPWDIGSHPLAPIGYLLDVE